MNKMVLIPHAKYQHLLKKSETPEISEAESQTEPLSAQEAEEEGQAVGKSSSTSSANQAVPQNLYPPFQLQQQVQLQLEHHLVLIIGKSYGVKAAS